MTADNAAQIRDAIDNGETADKVDHPDPAASPLGTDAEASGNPVDREQARMAARAEASRPAAPATKPGRIGGVLVVVAGFAVVILLGVWALL